MRLSPPPLVFASAVTPEERATTLRNFAIRTERLKKWVEWLVANEHSRTRTGSTCGTDSKRRRRGPSRGARGDAGGSRGREDLCPARAGGLPHRWVSLAAAAHHVEPLWRRGPRIACDRDPLYLVMAFRHLFPFGFGHPGGQRTVPVALEAALCHVLATGLDDAQFCLGDIT